MQMDFLLNFIQLSTSVRNLMTAGLQIYSTHTHTHTHTRVRAQSLILVLKEKTCFDIFDFERFDNYLTMLIYN